MCKKKVFALLLAASMILGLAACSNTAATEPAATPEATTAAETAAPETQAATAAPETTASPETTAAPETTAVAETTAAPETAGSYNSREAALPDTYLREEKNDAADAANAPRVTTLPSGVQVQKTPFDNTVKDGKFVSSWNNLYMDADNRGCNACHTLEDALEMMDTYHGIIYFKYDTEQTYANCIGCHTFYEAELKETIHTIHMKAGSAFEGSCQSCHYIDPDGNFLRWDYVKYDVLAGITDIAAENVTAEFDWNQTEITPVEKMYFKSIKSAPSEWLTDDSQINEDIFKNWTIKVTGDVDNPFEMTLPEMIEEFGLVTQVMKSHCTVNGPGQATIYQAEVTGIPVAKILEKAGVQEGANWFEPIGGDGYCYPLDTQYVLENDGLIVVEMNGQTIPANQGYPNAFWCYNASAGDFTKRVVEICVSNKEGEPWGLFNGDFIDPANGLSFDKPNSAVLNATVGQIFKQGETIHLEGYADAWNEPIKKIEFSFDRGETWIEYELENAVSEQWVYWTYDITIPDAGAYVMEIRVTSDGPDGDRVCVNNTVFEFNIQ